MFERSSTMTGRIRLVITATAVLAIVGCQAGAGLDTAAPTLLPDPPSTPAPSAATSEPLGLADIDRRLPPGSYRIDEPFDAPFSIAFPTEWSLKSLSEGDASFQNTHVNGGDGAAWITIDRVESVYDDPCHGESIDLPPSATVDGLVTALTSMVGFTPGPVTDAVVGGRPGKAVELRNEIATSTAGCKQGQMLPMWTFRGGTDAATNGWSRENLWIVDVDGEPLLIDGTMFIGSTPEDSRTEIEQVVQTIRFGSASPAPVPSVAPAAAAASPAGPHRTYVALGDSLLYAAPQDCDGCTSAAVLYAHRLEADGGPPVEVHNLTMHNGLTSTGLLGYLRDGARIGRDPEDVVAAVASADIVSVTIGFNDFGSPVPDPEPLMPPFEDRLDGILRRIEELRAGQPTSVLVTQIYNNGGPAWTPMVEAQNKVICEVAARHDAVCVDIYRPFAGPDGSGPAALGYLGADQTHPSQLGMEVIAEAMATAE